MKTTISLLAVGCLLIISLSINLSVWHANKIKLQQVKDTVTFDTLHSEIPYDTLTSRKLETAD